MHVFLHRYHPYIPTPKLEVSNFPTLTILRKAFLICTTQETPNISITKRILLFLIANFKSIWYSPRIRGIRNSEYTASALAESGLLPVLI